jgi:hypothetical protein
MDKSLFASFSSEKEESFFLALSHSRRSKPGLQSHCNMAT